MTNLEVHSLKSSSSRLELYSKAELIRKKITRTFSEGNPHRKSELKILDALVNEIAETLPPFIANQLRSIENSVAEASSLAQRDELIAKFEPLAARISEVRPAIDRGISRWETSAALREEKAIRDTELQKQGDRAKLDAARTIEKALSTIESDVEKVLGEIVHQDGQDAITAGRVIEALFRIDGFSAAADLGSNSLNRYLLEASKRISPPRFSLILDAARYFARSNGVLVYMRHPASSPALFYGLEQDHASRPTGVLIRQLSSGTFQAEHASRDRVNYGKQVDGRDRFRVEPLPSAGEALGYIKSLGAKHWYTNFLHPCSPLSEAPRYPYPEEEHRVFISWKDRAQRSFDP